MRTAADCRGQPGNLVRGRHAVPSLGNGHGLQRSSSQLRVFKDSNTRSVSHGSAQIATNAAASAAGQDGGPHTYQVEAIELISKPAGDARLFYIPGADGSGAAIDSQLPALSDAGFAVVALCTPPANRSGWDELVQTALPHLEDAYRKSNGRVTLLAESFGACLAMRMCLKAPMLVSNMVLINSATCFQEAWGGLPSLLSSTGVLSFFPKPLFGVARAVILPLLVDTSKAVDNAADNLQRMMKMDVPTSAPATAPTPDENAIRQLFGYAPAATVDWRLALLRTGNLTDEAIKSIQVPTVLLCSMKDRLFPSMQEGARLQKLIPDARRVVLPYSGHTPMLERDMSIVNVIARAGFLPQAAVNDERPATSAADAANGSLTTRGGRRAGADLARLEVHAHNGSGSLQPVEQVAGTRTGGLAVDAASANELQTRALQDIQALNASTAGVGESSGIGASQSPLNGSASNANGDVTRSQQVYNTGRSNGSASNGASIPMSQASHSLPNEEDAMNIGLVHDGYEVGIAQFRIWHDAISPLTLGLENVPPLGTLQGRPLLFIGNHTQFGLYDLPLLFMEMYGKGYQLTALAHPKHWQTPLGPFFESFGALKASPMAAFRALSKGQNVLLFPGGGREVVKRRGEEYTLLWKDEVDFVRLAARCNAIIVPFAAVGADDAFDIFMDTDEILSHPLLGPLASAFVRSFAGADSDLKEAVMPITKVPGTPLPSPIPLSNLGRVYFKFAEPFDTVDLNVKDAPACAAAYSECKARVEEQISQLLDIRERDPRRSGWARLTEGVRTSLGLVSASYSGAQEAEQLSVEQRR